MKAPRERMALRHTQSHRQHRGSAVTEFPRARCAIGGLGDEIILHAVDALGHLLLAFGLHGALEHALLNFNDPPLGKRNAGRGMNEHPELLRAAAAVAEDQAVVHCNAVGRRPFGLIYWWRRTGP